MALFQTFIRYRNVFAASCGSAGGFGKPLNGGRPKHLLLPFDVLLQIGSEGFVIKKGYALGKIFVGFNFLKMMGLAKFVSETLENIARGVATARRDCAYQHIYSAKQGHK